MRAHRIKENIFSTGKTSLGWSCHPQPSYLTDDCLIRHDILLWSVTFKTLKRASYNFEIDTDHYSISH